MTTPGDVDEIELHKVKLSLAASYGFQGSALELFADRIVGETREDIEQDAARFAADIASFRRN